MQKTDGGLAPILDYMREKRGFDFSGYPAMLLHRIGQRLTAICGRCGPRRVGGVRLRFPYHPGWHCAGSDDAGDRRFSCAGKDPGEEVDGKNTGPDPHGQGSDAGGFSETERQPCPTACPERRRRTLDQKHPVSHRNEKGRLISYDGLVRDITVRKQAEEEKKVLEGRLNRAEKMEALGTLAGGVGADECRPDPRCGGLCKKALCQRETGNGRKERTGWKN
jgi:hypothetical protein